MYLKGLWIILVSALVLTGCDRETAESVRDSITPHLEEGVNSLRDGYEALSPKVKELSESQVQALSQIEYQTFEVTEETLEAGLQQVGSQGWDCFQILTLQAPKLRLVCKRRPQSYLPMVFRLFSFVP